MVSNCIQHDHSNPPHYPHPLLVDPQVLVLRGDPLLVDPQRIEVSWGAYREAIKADENMGGGGVSPMIVKL